MAHFHKLFSSLVRASLFAAAAAALLSAGHPCVNAQEGDDTPDAVSVFNEAQDLHEKNDLAGAISMYQKALTIIPEFPEAEYQKGVAQLALGKNVDAERSFRRAVELRPDWTLAMTSLGALLVQEATKDRLREAELLLQKALEMEPQNPPALVAMSDLRLKTKAALSVLSDLLASVTELTGKANPIVSLWTARAGLESALGKRTEAKASLASALAAAPRNRNALFQLADIALTEGDTARAIDIASTLDKAEPNDDNLYLLRANIAAADGDLDGAVKYLDNIKQRVEAAELLRERITAGRTTNAADLEKKLETAPNDPAVLGRLCTIYRRDDPSKAIIYCGQASEAEPGNMNHAVGLGAALVQAKQFDTAVVILRKIVAAAPDNTTARANLATALFQLKRLPEAKAEFLWLTEAQPRSAAAYLFLGIIHDQMNEYLHAMANYQQFLRLADPAASKLDIDKVNLRLPTLQKLVKTQKGKSSSSS